MNTESILTYDQKIKTGWKMINDKLRMKVEIRYDDECKNGHNTFSITGTIEEKRGNRFYDYAGGCIHEEIEKHYPEYAHLIKWHLVSSDEPMHYLSNALYLASNKDCWGRRKGEVASYELAFKFKNFPITSKMPKRFVAWIQGLGKNDIESLKIESIAYVNQTGDNYKFANKYTYQGYANEWHYCPFDTEIEAQEFKEALQLGFEVVQKPTAWSEGKERELDAARRVAIWPEATDKELMSDDLKEKLIDRLPGLMSAFKADIELLGFTY